MQVIKRVCLIFIFIVVAQTLATFITVSAAQLKDDIRSGQGVSASSATREKALRVARFENRPNIDARLDEAVWQHATILRNFVQTQPGDNLPPSQATEVSLGYDEQFLYIGIQAQDEAGKVRATVAKRDDVLKDDYISIYLDTFNDKRRAYLLIFNPLGVQQDGIYSEGQEPDYSVDIVMQSKGLVTDKGYTIEVAIPLKSLRYEIGEGKFWGLQVQRRIKHLNDEEDSWMPLVRGQSGFLIQAGLVTGFADIASGRALEIIPSLTLSETGRRVPVLPPGISQSDVTGRLVNQPVAFDTGLTMKFGLTSNITLDLALNPDFAQVEADQPVVTANQRFPLFFEEKRPFFLEGIDIFQTPLKVVHTRTIVDPDIALKLSGKRQRNTFGLLLATDNAPGNFSEEELANPILRPDIERFIDRKAYIGVLRLKRDFGQESNLGLIATSYNFIEKHNQLFGIDGRFSLDRQTTITFQALGTTARRFFYDPESDHSTYRTGKGFGYSSQVQRTGRHLNVTLSGNGRTADYVADVGFTSRTDTNAWDLQVRYNSEPKPDSRLISWSLASSSHMQFDWRGRSQYSYQAWRSALNFKRQTYLKADFYTDYARVFEEEFGAKRTAQRQGAFLGEPERSTVWQGFTIEAGATPGKKYSTTVVIDRSWKAFDYDFGAGAKFPRVSPLALTDPYAPLDPGPGNTTDMIASFNWQPTDGLRTSLSYTKSRLVRRDTQLVAYDQNLYSLRSTYQFTPFTFIRARMDYDSLQANIRAQLLAGWTPNPGTSVYLGYNDDLNYNAFGPFTGYFEKGFQRNRRTFFIKMSYLFRRNL
jgi:hypothetical protein